MKTQIVSIFLFFILPQIRAQTLNYYFGNLHAHTAFSDGNKDSVSSGVSRPDASYAYAKLSDNFDFLGISEHNHYSNNKNPGFKLPRYQQGLNMALEATQQDTFLALFGMEYGISSGNNGHVLIYGFNQLIGWEASVPGLTGNNYDIYNAKTDYAALFKKVRNRPGSFSYLAHPYWTDFSSDGTDSSALAFSDYDAGIDSAVVGMPLRSGNAFSTFESYDDYPEGNYFNFYKKLLYLGYHLGIGYDHDNHYTNFGRSNAGRLVVLAPNLNYLDFMEAMQQMHFYGSDDANAKLDFRVNGKIMGSVITENSLPTITVNHLDPENELADTIRIWKGSKNSGGLWAWTVYTGLQINTATYTDRSISPGKEYYYFVEIRQTDGDWMVSSPIWYTATEAIGIPEIKTGKIEMSTFSNTAQQKLEISFAECSDYLVSLYDLSARCLLQIRTLEKELQIDLATIHKGLYVLKVTSQNRSTYKRILVE